MKAVLSLPWRIEEQTRIMDADNNCICDLAESDNEFSFEIAAAQAREIARAINEYWLSSDQTKQ